MISTKGGVRFWPLTADPGVESREVKLFSLIVAGGALLRFFNLGQRQLWVDEIIRLQPFSHSSWGESLAAVINIVAAAPLDFMIQHLFVALWGQSEFAARFHAAFFGSLSLPVLYWMGKRFFSTQVALLGMLLFALYPLHHQYSQEGGNYSLFCFLSLSCYYLLCRALGSRRAGWWILYTLAATLLLYTNYFGGVLLISQAAFLISLKSETVRRSLKFPLHRSWMPSFLLFLLCAGAAALSFLPWLLATLHRTIWDSPNIFSEAGLFLRIFKEVSGGGYPLSLLLLPLFGLGVHQLLRRQHWAAAALLLVWFVFPLPIILFLDWSRQYFFPIRQLLFTTPALFLGVAMGIERLPGLIGTERRGQKVRMTILILIMVLSLGSIYRHAGRDQADWKGLAEGMKTTVRGDDRVVAPNIDNVLSYYYPEMDERNLPIQQLVDGDEFLPTPQRQRIYLVASIYMTANQKETVNQLLAVHEGRPVHQFKGFQVYDLRLKRPE